MHLYVAKTENKLCPVSRMLPYLVLRGPSPRPLFVMEDRTPLTRQTFTDLLRNVFTAAGVNQSMYAAHSFRMEQLPQPLG